MGVERFLVHHQICDPFTSQLGSGRIMAAIRPKQLINMPLPTYLSKNNAVKKKKTRHITNPRDPITLSVDDWDVQSPPKRIVI